MAQHTREQSKIIDYIVPLFDIKAWSGFGNQPDGDKVTVVSDSASDTGKCTIFGTNKTTGAFQYETVTLTGKTPVDTTLDSFDDVMGIFLGDIYGKNTKAAVGTITVKEKTGGATITTIATTKMGIGLIAFYGLQGRDVMVVDVSGNLFLYDNGVATTANSYPFGSAEKFSFTPAGNYFSLISDSSAATAKIVVWK